MKKAFFIQMAIVAVVAVFAVGCTTSRDYGSVRYVERYPHNYYYDRGYYDSYPVIIESYRTRPGYYNGNRDRYYRNNNNHYYNNNRNNNYNRNNEYNRPQQQQQYEQQRRDDQKKIDDSKRKILGKKD